MGWVGYHVDGTLQDGCSGAVEAQKEKTSGQVSNVSIADVARKEDMNTSELRSSCRVHRRRLIGGQHELEDDILAAPETALPNTSDTTGNL
jgi:transposase-like protein